MNTSSSVSPRISEAVNANAALWMAGHVLTSGAFLSYFAHDLQASAMELALLAAAPELVGSSGLLAPLIQRLLGSRRRAWLVMTLLARALILGIPFAGMPWQGSGQGSVGLLLGLVIVSQFFQGIATTLYFAWLSDLVPSTGWGPLFARRNIAVLLVQMTFPLVGAWLRDYWKSTLPPESLWQAYAGIFAVGVGFVVASIWPMLWVPAGTIPVSMTEKSLSVGRGGSLRELLRQPALQAILVHSWCLAIANGLTQAVFFKYQIAVVGLSLWGYFVLVDVMLALQLVGTFIAGRCRVAADHRRVLFWGTLGSSLAIPFWFLASRDQWYWLIGAFVCWGAFGAVNVAGPNLLFCFSPVGQTAQPVALFRQVAGTLAGLSGIVGGRLLDLWLPAGSTGVLWPYFVLFGLSGVGRLAAALLVLRVPVQPSVQGDREKGI